MYNINDTVLYGADGVCRITGVTEREVGGQLREYLVLKPISSSSSTIFVPTQGDVINDKMRRVLSREEVFALINSIPAACTIWVDDTNTRRQRYREILTEGDRYSLVKLIKTLHLRSKLQKEQGKKLHVTDERFMREAENLLYGEFAYVLEVEQGEVLPLIIGQIGELG